MRTRSFLSSASICVSIVLILFSHAHAQPARSPFSSDSALAYLKVLAEDIGPRPMGSPNERAAMEFALRKFREFGLDEAFILPFYETVTYELGGSVNTKSGTAVGVLRGESKRTIVIGAHIDSANPDIPGANDDGSGSAVVLELARILKQRRNESTIVFALFGGEEHGLRGSRHFVNNFDGMDDVALMLQVDMANGSEWILPLVDIQTHSAPEWLLRASYEELEKFGHSGLSFPTHFYAFIKSLPQGGIGSDHEPFLEKNIPAICFTTDVTDPIHTPQDHLANFKPSGLKRSGDLVYGLVTRFDGGVPEDSEGRYYLLQFDSLLLFIPLPVLYAVIFLAIGFSVLALLQLRKRGIPEEPRRKIPGLKLFLLMLIIQIFVWSSESLVAFLKGVRFAWVTEPFGYYVLGFVAAIAGIWVCLQLAPHLNLTRNAYRYALRSVVFLLVFVTLSLALSVKLALYPALGLLFLALSFVVRHPIGRALLWLVSPLFMFRLIFSEGYLLLARSLTHVPGEFWAGFMTHLFYVLFFSTWAFPFLLGFASIRCDSGPVAGWIRWFKKPVAGMITGVAAIALIVVLTSGPSYSGEWKQTISVRQNVDLDSGRVTAEVLSSEYLTGAKIRSAGLDTVVTARVHKVQIPAPQGSQFKEWLQVERTVTAEGDSNTTFSILLKIKTPARPYTLSVTYRGGTETPADVSTPFTWSPGLSSIALRWYSFPESSLTIPIEFTVVGSDSVKEYIEATFVELPIQVEVEKPLATTVRRAIVSRSEVLR